MLSKAERKHPLKLKISNEILLNAGSKVVRNTFDQNRFYTGVNYAITKNISVECGYLNWFQQRPTGDQFYNRNILRLSLFHKIPAKVRSRT
jgi:hypothetical protein